MGNELLDGLDKISNTHAKYEVSKELAKEFLRRDMADDALQAKEKIPEGYETDSTTLEIVRKYVKLGRVDDAEKLASQINGSNSKKLALKAINKAK